MSVAIGFTAADIARALGGRRCGTGWICKCVAHDDHSPTFRSAREMTVAFWFTATPAATRATLSPSWSARPLARAGRASRLSSTRTRSTRKARDSGRIAWRSSYGARRSTRVAPGSRITSLRAGSRLPVDPEILLRTLRFHPALPVPRQDEGDRHWSPPSRRSGPRCRTIPSSIRRRPPSTASAAAATTTRPCSARSKAAR